MIIVVTRDEQILTRHTRGLKWSSDLKWAGKLRYGKKKKKVLKNLSMVIKQDQKKKVKRTRDPVTLEREHHL